jgi:peptide methionine sulfoxide reductase MsrA
MERPEYRFPSSSACLPTGWIAVPLDQYRSDMMDLSDQNRRIVELREKNRDLIDQIDPLSARMEEIDAFLAAEPYAQKLLDDYREYMKKKETGEDAAAEDS